MAGSGISQCIYILPTRTIPLANTANTLEYFFRNLLVVLIYIDTRSSTGNDPYFTLEYASKKCRSFSAKALGWHIFEYNWSEQCTFPPLCQVARLRCPLTPSSLSIQSTGEEPICPCMNRGNCATYTSYHPFVIQTCFI